MRLRIRSTRRGFTLIELLVTMTIIAIIATLAILVAPRFNERQKKALGASQVQNWLFIAKQRAYRDHLGRGVLLIRDIDNANYVKHLYYIEQPDDFSQGTIAASGGLTNSVGTVVTFNLPAGVDLRAVCSPGDYLAVGDTPPRAVYQIASVPAFNQVTTTTTASGIAAGAKYSIIRKVRVMDGEPALQLPQDVVIDLSQAPVPLSQVPGTRQYTLPDGSVRDGVAIMFTKMGGTTQDGVGLGKIVLYVRDSTLDSVLDGEPTLIVVYTRTGFVAAHPVNPDLTDLFKFARDGRSSGL